MAGSILTQTVPIGWTPVVIGLEMGYEHRVVGENREPVVHPFGIGGVLPVRKEPCGIGERQSAFDLVDLGRERDCLRGARVDGS
jgi:hypothetical protein